MVTNHAEHTVAGPKPDRARRQTLLLILALTLARLAIAAFLGLGVDESHYVMYARHPAWGYLDHPPMVAVLGQLSRLFGPHPFWVRLGPVLCSAGAMLLLRRLAIGLGLSERAALFAIVAINLMPGFHVMAPALLPDATLNLFWILALLATWKAIHSREWLTWIAVGITVGLALLSKYHGVLLPACLALFVLATPRFRPWISRPHPFVAGLVALLVFAPNIVWNARNAWISYVFQLKHGGGKGALSISNVLESIGGQMAFAGPVMLLLLPAAAWAAWKSGRQTLPVRYLIWTSLPVFVFFMLIGSFGKILPHWPFVGWWSGALLLGHVLDYSLRDPVSRSWQRAWKTAVVTSVIAIVLMYAVLTLPVIPRIYLAARNVSASLSRRFPALPTIPPYDPKIDISNDLYGWKQIARESRRILENQPDPERTFLFCHRFFSASQIAVHLPDNVSITSLNQRPDQYRLWFNALEHRGWNAVFIDHDRYEQPFERYLGLFESGDPEPVEFVVRRGSFPAHRIRFYSYRGFKGDYDAP